MRSHKARQTGSAQPRTAEPNPQERTERWGLPGPGIAGLGPDPGPVTCCVLQPAAEASPGLLSSPVHGAAASTVCGYSGDLTEICTEEPSTAPTSSCM